MELYKLVLLLLYYYCCAILPKFNCGLYGVWESVHAMLHFLHQYEVKLNATYLSCQGANHVERSNTSLNTYIIIIYQYLMNSCETNEFVHICQHAVKFPILPMFL